MSEYSIAIKIMGQLEGSFRQAIKGAQSGLSGLGVSGKVGSLALKGVGLAAKATVASMTAAGTAIAAVGVYSAKVGKEFESQMSTVQAISGASGAEFDALKDKAVEMGEKSVFSATEAAKAMEYMGMAGWKTGDMLDGIEGVMNLAAASGEDLAMVSDIVTDSLTAFGMTAKDSNSFADLLAQTARSANTDVQKMGETFKYVAPVAGAMGYSARDTALAIGLMGSAGIKSSQAGTSLRSWISRMAAPTKQTKDAMDALGLSLTDSQGNMKSLDTVMAETREAFSGLTKEQKAQYASALAGKNGMSGLLAVVNASEKDITGLSTALNNSSGAAAEMAAVRLDNLEGDIKLLNSAAESFGITLYTGMQGPFREVVQYGTEQIKILKNAFNEGGFEGLTSAIGTVLADGLQQIANNAPQFIDASADLLEALVDGLDQNAESMGGSLARLGTALANAFIRITPRVAATGIHIMTEFGKGMLDNLPVLKDSAIEAVSYFMGELKSAFKSYVNFLGDDEVEPFKKVLLALPALLGGFAIFDGIGGTIKGFVGTFKGAGKQIPRAAKGIGGAGSAMAASAKNFLAFGAGIALAAGGMWLLADAAKTITQAGPSAAIAMGLMVGGIAALMSLAGTMGPQLQASSTGLIAFGASVVLAAAGMMLMAYAASQLAQAGPGALAGMLVMVGGMAGMLAIVGSLGAGIAAATPGLLAFGAAVLMASGGFLIAAVAVQMFANTAIMMASAGAPAIAMLAGLAAGILVFGAAAGVLAPLLAAGGAALGVFGAGLIVVGAGALIASAALTVIAGTLPSFATYGMTAATAIMMLGTSFLLFGAGAAVAGAAGVVAAAGITALGVASGVAAVAFVPLSAAIVAAGAAIAIISSSASTAADGITKLTSFGPGAIASMAALAAGMAPVTAALVPLAAAFAATTAATTAFLASLLGINAGLIGMGTGIALVLVSMLAMSMALTAFQTSASGAGPVLQSAGMGFTQFAMVAAPVAGVLMTLVGPMASAGQSAMILSTGMRGAASGVVTMSSALLSVVSSTMTASNAFTAFTVIVQVSMTTANASVKSGIAVMRTTMITGSTAMRTAVTQQFSAMASAVSSYCSRMVASCRSAASGIRSAFSGINLHSIGANIIQGLINGLNSRLGALRAKATEIASTVKNITAKTNSIGSPGKVQIQQAEWMGEGLVIGLNNKIKDVRNAAMALNKPIQTAQANAMSVPDVPVRTGVIGETIDSMNAGTTNNTTTNQSASPTFYFNPTYVIEGNADQEVIQEVNKMSQAEFNRMMDKWVRDRGRVQFA